VNKPLEFIAGDKKKDSTKSAIEEANNKLLDAFCNKVIDRLADMVAERLINAQRELIKQSQKMKSETSCESNKEDVIVESRFG